MKKLISLLFTIAIISLNAQVDNKMQLSHNDYDHWKNLSNAQISNDGKWICYEINPQKGDGFLYVYNISKKTTDSIARGYRASFSPVSAYLTFQIKTQLDTVRKAKLNKIKKDKMPKDSLGIWNLSSNKIDKYARIKSYKMAKEESEWLAVNFEKELPSKDTTTTDTTIKENTKKEKKGKKKNDDPKGTDLLLILPGTDISHNFSFVTDYSISKNGKLISFISNAKDSIETKSLNIFNTLKEENTKLFDLECDIEKLTIDEKGQQLAFLMSEDTAKVKVYDLYFWNENSNYKNIINKETQFMPEGWCVSKNSSLSFSKDGERLYFGNALIPVEEPKDTLLADDKVSLDIWNWKDQKLQPMQLKELKREEKRTYNGVYHISSNSMVQLENEELKDVNYNLRGLGNYGLGRISDHYGKYQSWEGKNYADVYLVDQNTGEKKMIREALDTYPGLTFYEKFIYWFDNKQDGWIAYDIIDKVERNITKSIPYQLTNELDDRPDDARPYGIVGVSKDDEFILIYDRYDIWKVDLKGVKDPICITKEYGRKNDITFRRKRLDREETYIDLKEEMILYAFDEKSKASGFYKLNKPKSASDPESLIFEDNSFSSYSLIKSKDEDVVIWTKQNFTTYPDLWVSDLDFSNTVKISNTNPQQKNYKWGTSELVHWTSFDRIDLDGILYKPEDFDPEKKYPVIVYFYERSSNRLHSHHTPKPSRSTINISYYVSNDYIVFVPDIVYKVGYPGQSAYNAIVSGTMALIEKYQWINKDKIGLQGQSWGGYQTAYLVTQTNLYAAGMAGAPVSNMTSAYGGIRWGSGMSRMFQYEHTQSRIGGTLWEKPWRYIENSPVFYADKVETPLLMMHNDNDGAVPWYQGIEYFVALRRLEKPVWMLTYNGAPHNLSRRADSQDLSKRMSQFFDHYLKDKPAPIWMEYGVPAIKKGKDFGFELVK